MTEEAPKTAPADPTAEAPKENWYLATGRRKTAVARVRLRPGTGQITINGRKPEEYFFRPNDRRSMVAALEATQTLGKMDLSVTVHGGGHTGQSEAILLGVARALKKMDPAYEAALRSAGHLTRDSRMVERKKYGQAGARRRFQFSKR